MLSWTLWAFWLSCQAPRPQFSYKQTGLFSFSSSSSSSSQCQDLQLACPGVFIQTVIKLSLCFLREGRGKREGESMPGLPCLKRPNNKKCLHFISKMRKSTSTVTSESHGGASPPVLAFRELTGLDVLHAHCPSVPGCGYFLPCFVYIFNSLRWLLATTNCQSELSTLFPKRYKVAWTGMNCSLTSSSCKLY